MKIVRPYMRMLTTGAVMDKDPEISHSNIFNPLGFVEWCGRISHRSEDLTGANAEKFIRAVVLGHGDWSITEHCLVSVDAIVDRGITHEIVRHRLASYTQESTRFVNYMKKMPPSFVYPIVGIDCPLCLDGSEPTRLTGVGTLPPWRHDNNQVCKYHTGWLDAIDTVEKIYIALITQGWRPQEARSVFPNALASRIIITMNLRQWRHFFIMRTTKEAHPQMRQVTIPLLAEFQAAIPVLYEDLSPNATQVENLRKPQ
jgi:thymidylate synthase (FAD)